MNKITRISEDVIKNEAELFHEVNTIINEVRDLRIQMLPYIQHYSVTGVKPLPLAQFLASSKIVAQSICSIDFKMAYPNLTSAVINGATDDSAMNRMFDGMYKYQNVRARLKETKYLVKTDEDRTSIANKLNEVLADFIIFALLQFGLSKLDEGGVHLSVEKACQKMGLTARVIADLLYEQLLETGEPVYGYEDISEYKSELNEMDFAFLAECEEEHYALTPDICEEILRGSMSITAARTILVAKKAETISVEINTTPSDLIRTMNL